MIYETYIIYTIIISILLYFIYKQIKLYIYSIYIKSSVDNNFYLVRNTFNKLQSANTLALINSRIKKLLNILNNYNYKNDINVKLLISRYNPSNLMENITLDNTTYTINKGSEVSVCLATRDKNENVYDINKLMFVIIHELAHIGCVSHGHNNEFVKFFTFLLKICIENELYIYQDYSKEPVEYCGIIINTSPI